MTSQYMQGILKDIELLQAEKLKTEQDIQTQQEVKKSCQEAQEQATEGFNKRAYVHSLIRGCSR